MLVILDSMKMKNSILVNHVTQLVKNVQPEPITTVLNVMKTPTQKTANVNQSVKAPKYMKMLTHGNVNHATAIVLNVLVQLNTVVPNVQEVFTIMKESVLPHVQMDISQTLKQILVTHVTKNV